MEKTKKGVRLEHISKIYKDPKTGKDFYAVKDTSLEIKPGLSHLPFPLHIPGVDWVTSSTENSMEESLPPEWVWFSRRQSVFPPPTNG